MEYPSKLGASKILELLAFEKSDIAFISFMQKCTKEMLALFFYKHGFTLMSISTAYRIIWKTS